MIQPIVEGQGDVAAVPILLRRVMNDGLATYGIGVSRPIRHPRDRLLSQDGLRRVIETARRQPVIAAILVVFDLDDDCARDFVPDLVVWGQTAAAPLPFGVVLARREYEAWFLASLTSLAGKGRIRANAEFRGDPEAVRGAKERLGRFMPRDAPYDARVDQPRFSAQFDLGQAYRGASSFRKLVKELCRLLTELGHSPVIPPDWTAG